MNFQQKKEELLNKLANGQVELNAVIKEMTALLREEKQAIKAARKEEANTKNMFANYIEDTFANDEFVIGVLEKRGKVFVDLVLEDGKLTCKAHFPVIK